MQDKSPSGTENEDRALLAEQLEPRILYSATPGAEPPQEAQTAESTPEDAGPVDGAPEQPQEDEVAAQSPAPAENSEISDEALMDPETETLDAENQIVYILNQEDVESIAAAAADRWEATGLSLAQQDALASITYRIGDLGAYSIGETEGNVITIDDDAAGLGWFFDTTPDLDEEFEIALGEEGSAYLSDDDDEASRAYDLLTVLLHEQGHILGLEHAEEAEYNVLHEEITAGTRLLPIPGQADGAIPSSLEGPVAAHTGLTQITIADQTQWDAAVTAGLDAGDEVVFNGAGTAVTITGNVTVGAVHFQAGAFTLDGGSLTIVGGSIEADVDASINSVLEGPDGITKTGVATLTLSGTNTYAGKTTINAGTISISADANLGAVPGSAVADQLLINGGTLEFTSTGHTSISVNRGITIGASGATIDTSTIGLFPRIDLSSIITGSGPLTLAANGNLADGGGQPGYLRLGNNGNNFSGDVTITSGVVAFSSDAAFGAVTNDIVIEGGGIVSTVTATLPASRDIVLSGGGDKIFRVYGNRTFTIEGNITGDGNVRFTDAGTLALNGANSFTGDLIAAAGTDNTLALGGANTYSGDTIAIEGTIIRLDAAGVIPHGAGKGNVTITSGILDLNGFSQTLNGLSSEADGTIDNSGATNAVLTFGTENTNGTLYGVIQDSGAGTLSLVKTGTGATEVFGTTNTYEGGTTIEGGYFKAVSDGSLGAVPSTPTVNITIRDGGILQNRNSDLDLDVNRTVLLENGEGRIRSGWVNRTITINGQITGPGTFRIVNDSSAVELTNSGNDYTGDTIIGGNSTVGGNGHNANLRLGGTNVIPNGAGFGNLIFDSGSSTAILDLNGNNETVNGISRLTGSAVVQNSSGNATLTAGDNNASTTYTGSFNDSGTGTLALEKTGSGVLIITGTASTYSGGTTISGGTLRVFTDSTLGAVPSSVDPDNIIIQNNARLKNNGAGFALDANRGITLAPTHGTFEIRGGTVLEITGPITGSGNLSKIDSGTLLLSGVNDYTGDTLITEGVLELSHTTSNNIATSSTIEVGSAGTLDVSPLLDGEIVLATTQTLQGEGSVVGEISGVSGSTVSPGLAGSGDPGILSTSSGDLDLATGVNFDVDINGTTAGADYDQIDVTGGVDLANATLNLALGFGSAAGDKFTLINNDGADPASGVFANYPDTNNDGISDAFSLSFGGASYVFHIDYGRGASNATNNVVLVSAGIAETSVEVDGTGKLIITDINGATSIDNISVTDDGTNYIIADPNLALTTGTSGATQVDVNTIWIPKTQVTNGLTIMTLGAADTVTLVDSTGTSPLDFGGDLDIDAETVNLDASLASGNALTLATDGVVVNFDDTGLPNGLGSNYLTPFEIAADIIGTNVNFAGSHSAQSHLRFSGDNSGLSGDTLLTGNNTRWIIASDTAFGAAGDTVSFGTNNLQHWITADGNRTIAANVEIEVGRFIFGQNATGVPTGNLTITGDVLLSQDSGATDFFLFGSRVLTFDGVVSGTTGIEVEGGHWNTVLALTNPNNTFSGDITFRTSTGTIAVANAGALGAPGNSIIFESNGKLRFDGEVTNATQNVTIATNITATINSNGNDGTFDGTVSGQGSLNKIGTGTLTLTNTNTYAGTTTVEEGTLIVNGTNDNGDTVTVDDGATLGGNGTINAEVLVNGTLAPGDVTDPTGTLTLESLDFGSTGSLSLQIDSDTTGAFDLLKVTGGEASLDNATITLSGDGIADSGDEIIIIDNDGSNDAYVDQFSGTPEGATVVIGGNRFNITYTGGDGNDVVLVRNIAPELQNLGGSTDYYEDSGSMPVDDNVLAFDRFNDDLTSATIQITTNFIDSEDALEIDAAALAGIAGGAITADLSVAGKITLSGDASPADYSAALLLVTYANSNGGDPDPATRTVTFTITDGELTDTETQDINVIPVNDAPVATDDFAIAIEDGGVANANTGTNPQGNVLTGVEGTPRDGSDPANSDNEDTDLDSSNLQVVEVTFAGTTVTLNPGDTDIEIAGLYGTLSISANGDYTYTVDQAAADVLDSGDSIIESFAYRIADQDTTNGLAASWDFTASGTATIQDWTLVSGNAYVGTLNSGDGIASGNPSGGHTHDDHPNAVAPFLITSGEFNFDTGATGVLLDVTFAGGAGDHGNVGQIYDTPDEVLAAFGGSTNLAGQKGLALYNTSTQTYDATYFKPNNGTLNMFESLAITDTQLIADGVDLSATYQLHYFDNDSGGWGWTKLSSVTVQGEKVTAEATLTVTVEGRNDAPVANDDFAIAVEDGGVGNATTGTNPQGNVITGAETAPRVDGTLDNSDYADTDVDNSSNLQVVEVTFAGNTVTLAPGDTDVQIAGLYGTLSISANGDYTYTVDQADTDFLDLGDSLLEEFTYRIADQNTLDGISASWTFSGATGNNIQDWTILNGAAYFGTQNDGDGIAAANALGEHAHDPVHEIFLAESGEFRFTLGATDPLVSVRFDGGAGDQITGQTILGGSNQVFQNPDAVIAYNGGNSNSTGQKGLAFYNVSTGQYDATLFDPANGGVPGPVQNFTAAQLTAAGVDLTQTYQLHFFDNDAGTWGWTKLNSVTIQGEKVSAEATLAITIEGSNDAPVAEPDTNTVSESPDDGVTPPASTTGNVLGLAGASAGDVADTDVDDDDNFGTAGSNTNITTPEVEVTGVAAGTTAVDGTGVSTVVIGTYGDLTLNADGSYSYVLVDARTTALGAGDSADEVFTYTITDSDGATAETTLTITVSGGNELPVISNVPTHPLTYTEGDGEQIISHFITITDSDDTTLTGATVTISDGYVRGEDVLRPGFTPSGVYTVWNSATGTLTFVGTATIEQYTFALREVAYENISDDPASTFRDFTFAVSDDEGTSLPVTRQFFVIPVDEPVVPPVIETPQVITDDGSDDDNSPVDPADVPAFGNGRFSQNDLQGLQNSLRDLREQNNQIFGGFRFSDIASDGQAFSLSDESRFGEVSDEFDSRERSFALTPFFSGVATPGATVIVEIFDEFGFPVAETMVSTSLTGDWYATFPGADLTGGDYRVKVTVISVDLLGDEIAEFIETVLPGSDLANPANLEGLDFGDIFGATLDDEAAQTVEALTE